MEAALRSNVAVAASDSRIFLTGANPFVLTVGRLTDIALFQHGGGRTIVVIKLLHVMSLLYM